MKVFSHSRWRIGKKSRSGLTARSWDSRFCWVSTVVALCGMLAAQRTTAGNLDPTNMPGGTMHTLDDIYWAIAKVAAPQQTLSPAISFVPAGYYLATNLTQVDPDLAIGNIRAGTEIFGVPGKSEVVDTGSGDAQAGDILAGKTAWVRGGEVTGTIPAGNNIAGADGTRAMPVPDGLYSGSKTATAHDADLIPGSVRGGIDLFGVVGDSNVVNTSSGNASANELLAGKKAWAHGTEVNGAMVNHGGLVIVPGTHPQTISQGYHDGAGYVTGDTDLARENIRAGVTIFGVSGHPYVVDTVSGDATAADIHAGKVAWVDGAEITGTATNLTPFPAMVARTGQNPSEPQSPAETGSDGDSQKGVDWPFPRFTDNADGTATDHLTGLIWLKDAGTLGEMAWTNALAACAGLNNGEAGLSDGSAEGDWRLPNIRELLSLMDYRFTHPPLPDTLGTGHFTNGNPFLNLQTWYWTSTTRSSDTNQAWMFVLHTLGQEASRTKDTACYVWPVRGGQ